MDRQLIKSLIDALAASDLSELEYASGTETLRLVKAQPGRVVPAAMPDPPASPAPSPGPAGRPQPELQAEVVVAPSYGLVHLRRSPGEAPLVATGDAVAAGQVLCLIEAMKVFTELRAKRGGTIAAILVETGQEVEAGQPLLRIS